MTENTKKVKGFFLFFEQYESIKLLSNEQKGMLLEAMFTKFAGDEYEITDPVVAMAFSFMERGFQQEKEKYFQICEKRKENIKKRWDTKNTNVSEGDTKNTNVYNCISDDTNEYKGIQTILKPELNLKPELKPDKNIFITPQVAEKKKSHFVPPTVEEVSAYATEAGLQMDANYFVDFFTSNGWKISGRAPMKDWKAAARNWARNSFSKTGTSTARHSAWEQKQQADIARHQALVAKVGW